MSSPKEQPKIRVGDLLVENGMITEDQLQEGLAEQKRTGKRIGRILVDLGLVEEARLLSLLSQQLQIPYVDLSRCNFEQELINLLSEAHARRFRAIVLSRDEVGQLMVGMSDPTDIFVFDELCRLLREPFQQAFVQEAVLLETIDRVYRRTADIENLAADLQDELVGDAFDMNELDVDGADESNVVVVKLLNLIFEDAIKMRASDVHIEPDKSVIRVRHRVDGVLQEQVLKEKKIASALVLRLKLMSGLNISEKRLPQDGRFNLKVGKRPIDVRLSTMPTQHGESVVMRLIDPMQNKADLDTVGMPPEMLKRFKANIHKPHGLILVTGPTGSGKTTTLYSALLDLNRAETKIITAEDPVEYQLPRIQQVQVNHKIGLDFSTVLRAILRQDPDIVLIGEIRDQETAEIALRASMTGHLVLSTLHTNDAISSAMRLVDMGVDGYLAASALNSVIAQRLVRSICATCIAPHAPDPQEYAWLVELVGDQEAGKLKFQDGIGCSACNSTGYTGRVGVFEYLELNEAMADALRCSDTAAFARAAKQGPRYKPLVYSALEMALKGETSLAEVMRVAAQVEGADLHDLMQQHAVSETPENGGA